ncbi:Chromosome-associated kinesin KIF4, partial [Armadillidium nasatum]
MTFTPENHLNTNQSKDIAVRVALRIRPLVPREKSEGCQQCLETSDESPQVIVIGTDKAFTYDFVFPPTASQEYIYEKSVSHLVKELFKGYNATVLAYGQTGSGKTYSMGTSSAIDDYEAGIIQRAVKDIFKEIDARSCEQILIKVSFIELYKENLYDLLNSKCREETIVDIREDIKGGIRVVGLTEIPVTSLEETMRCLESIGNNENIITSKFHLVDLAGSERAKKTGATGIRFKEGVNINKGLLALGNVISSLCGEGSKGHIPYRDSKLTRLLQDSLGGNSHTVMLACVSPADSNLEETITTLRYADRARKIKNKPIINRDPQAAELARLRQQIQQLQVQLLASASQSPQSTTVYQDSNAVNDLMNQVHVLEEENEKLTRALQTALEENTNMAEKALMAEMSRDQIKTRLEELRAQTGNTVDVLNKTFDIASNPQYTEQINLVKDLQKKIIDLQTEHSKREKAIVDHELSRHSVSTNTDESPFENDDSIEGEKVSPIKGEFGAAYTLRQAKLNEELQDLNRALAMKEELMTKMTQNDSRFVVMKSNYDKNMKDMEEQINNLMKEREELTQKLRNSGHQNASNKISEQRRKRLQELESLISGLKKKVGEQNKLIKMKEQSEQKVIKLNTEIQNMKSMRVKLIRQMKEDNEKFRKWKAQKDREVAKLKEADRKKQFQMVKMERLHTKQQNVLKRKMEEALAINKRLKDAMALQKACQEKRSASRDIDSVNNRMKCWLEGELQVALVKNQAKKSLQTLIDDRKLISEQLNKVKKQLNKEELSSHVQNELYSKKEQLEKDLSLRSAQINDIQSKIVDDGSDVSNKKRFESIQTLLESRSCNLYLFQVASECQAQNSVLEADLKDVNNQYEEMCQNLHEAETSIKKLKESYADEISNLSREHEDKILFLLRQMSQPKCDLESETQETTDEQLLQRLKFQEGELARLSNLHELLQEKIEECDQLKKQLQDKAPLSPKVEPKLMQPPSTPFSNKKPVTKPMKKSKIESEEESFSETTISME